MFQDIDHDVYITTLDSTTIRQNIRQCQRCKSIWHIIKDCPFAEDGAVAQGPRQTQQTASPKLNMVRAAAAAQVCYNWNAGRCNQPCLRRHVCEGCGGMEPRPRCISCNFGQKYAGNKQQNTPPPGSGGNFSSQSSVQTTQGRVA